MAKRALLFVAVVGASFMASGCVVRTYEATRDRVDQDLSGNRGYLTGAIPANQANVERPATRTSRIVEVELRNPFHFSRKARPAQPAAGQEMQEEGASQVESGEAGGPAPAVKTQKYTVQKNETLQKISQKLYGTTKNWIKIFNANKDVLKAPDKIYPGQVINVPEEGMLKPEKQENLK